MNKKDFLRKLAVALKSLPKDEVEKSVNFYAEMIDDRIEDGMGEKAAVKAVGTVDEAVKNIMLENTSLPTLVKARVSDSKNSASNQGLWIALVIIGSPLWFPIALAIAITILSVYLVIWCIVVTLYALEFALFMTGIAGIAMGVFHCFTWSLPLGLCYMGIGLICVAVTIFIFSPINNVARATVNLVKLFGLKVKSIFIKGGLRDEK